MVASSANLMGTEKQLPEISEIWFLLEMFIISYPYHNDTVNQFVHYSFILEVSHTLADSGNQYL